MLMNYLFISISLLTILLVIFSFVFYSFQKIGKAFLQELEELEKESRKNQEINLK